MLLSENPYFHRWIERSNTRINRGLASKEALTLGATRTAELSTPVVNMGKIRLELSSQLAATNLLDRLRKGP